MKDKSRFSARRSVLKAAGLATATAALGPFFHVRPAAADRGQLVVVGWGGAWTDALREVMFEPFAKSTGSQVTADGPPLPAKIQAMAQSGNVTWDVIETDLPAILTLVKAGLLEPIDYSKLDQKKLSSIPKDLQQEYGVGSSVYSLNIVFNTTAFPKGRNPHTWAEVWDAKQFSGGRTLNFGGGISPPLEIALLADGVPMGKLYPLDVERAWRSLDRIRPSVTKWFVSHGQGVEIIATGDAAVGATIAAQAFAAKRGGAPIDVDFNEGKMGANYWAIVKGGRNRDLAMAFINFAIDPEKQANMAKRVPYGPTSTEAFKFLSDDEAAVVPTSPRNIEKQFWWDVDWWGRVGPDGKTEREKEAEVFASWMLK
jgi:putative spermidine/putrescine transport system substrate-binding protein